MSNQVGQHKRAGESPGSMSNQVGQHKRAGESPGSNVQSSWTIQKSRGKPRLHVQSINASREFLYFAGRGSPRHPVVCFRGRGNGETQLQCGFPLLSARFFNTRHRAFYISGNRRQPYEQTFRAAVFLCVLLKFPVCLNYITGAGFAFLNAFAVSM